MVLAVLVISILPASLFMATAVSPPPPTATSQNNTTNMNTTKIPTTITTNYTSTGKQVKVTVEDEI
jgi:hypothetical protein